MEDLTQKEAAKRLEISVSWIRKLTKREVIYRNSDRSYPWPRCRDQFRAFKRATVEARHAGFGDESWEVARARKTSAQARLLEFEVHEREGRLIEIDEHLDIVREIVIGFRTAVLSLPTLAHDVVGLTTMPRARQALVEISERLLRQMRQVANQIDPEGQKDRS